VSCLGSVSDRLKPTHFEQDSFDGYTMDCEAEGFLLCGCGAGGGTGLVGVVGNNGGTVMTAEKEWTSLGDCDDKIEGKSDAEVC
jgi:hypothetical protein